MIIKKSGIPTIIMSDNDSSFLGDKFREFLDDNNIILDTNVKK